MWCGNVLLILDVKGLVEVGDIFVMGIEMLECDLFIVFIFYVLFV